MGADLSLRVGLDRSAVLADQAVEDLLAFDPGGCGRPDAEAARARVSDREPVGLAAAADDALTVWASELGSVVVTTDREFRSRA